MNGNKHIIHKLVLDVDIHNEAKAYQVKDGINSFLEKEVLPEMEVLFDERSGDDEIYRFDRLTLDVTVNNWANSEQIKKQIETQLRKKMDESFSASSETHLNGRQKYRNEFSEDTTSNLVRIEKLKNQQLVFFAFIESGFLPWYGKKEQITNPLKIKNWKESLANSAFFDELVETISKNEKALQRLIWQLPPQNILEVLSAMKILKSGKNRELLNELRKASSDFTGQLFLLVFQIKIKPEFLEENDLNELLKLYKRDFQDTQENGFINWIQSYFSETIAEPLQTDKNRKLFHNQHLIVRQERWYSKTETDSGFENNPTIIHENRFLKVSERESPGKKEPQEWIVQNAGQILFHPFLRYFFQGFDWLDEKSLLLPEHKMAAVQALHYCATGNAVFFEADMILEKFMCGIPLDAPVQSTDLLSAKMKREATFMLKELIRNWPVLKNTSPAGLREAFIQREGKLIKKEGEYKLIVERKVIDVLMEKLPWNISVVKMPWQRELLFVEW